MQASEKTRFIRKKLGVQLADSEKIDLEGGPFQNRHHTEKVWSAELYTKIRAYILKFVNLKKNLS